MAEQDTVVQDMVGKTGKIHTPEAEVDWNRY